MASDAQFSSKKLHQSVFVVFSTKTILTLLQGSKIMAKPKQDKEEIEQEISCFIIMPISDQPGYEHGHFSFVYEDIIKPAVVAAGMKPVRADETKNTNLIQLDILRKVIECDIAICDMSAKNPNVFYELGVRQAFDKPTVLMIDDETTAPFDVSSLRYVDYKKGMGYRDVKLAVDKLAQTLKDTYEKREDKSEINSLIRLMDLTTPAQLSQVDISEEDRTALQIAELTSSMHNLQASQIKILNLLNQTSRSSVDDVYRIEITKALKDQGINASLLADYINSRKSSMPIPSTKSPKI